MKPTFTYSFKDDLESVFYVILDLVLPHRRDLPWVKDGKLHRGFHLEREIFMGQEFDGFIEDIERHTSAKVTQFLRDAHNCLIREPSYDFKSCCD